MVLASINCNSLPISAMRVLGATLLALLATFPAGAQGTRIHMHGDGPYAADGLLYTPLSSGSADGVLLIPGVGGILPSVQNIAQAFVAAGYEVVVLDPNRSGPPDPGLTDSQAWADVGAALRFLSEQSKIPPARIVALGLGRGAQAVLRLVREGGVKAAAIESADAVPVLQLPMGTAVLASVAEPEGPARRATATGIKVEFYAPYNPASGDDGDLFGPADTVTVRQREIAFFAQQLRPQ